MLFGKKMTVRATRRQKVIFFSVAAALMALVLIFLTPYLMRRYEIRKKSYSGAPVNYSEQLLFDTEGLIRMKGIKSDKKPDGTYAEEIMSEDGAITVFICRDLERPHMSCGDLIKELRPGLTSLRSGSKKNDPSIVTERVTFKTAEKDGGEKRHTAILMRRNGWDYLVDFSVGANDSQSWEYIDTLIDHLFFM